MAQRLATYKSTVVIKGNDLDLLGDVHVTMAPRSRQAVNKRTGTPWTVIGDMKQRKTKDGEPFEVEFTIERPFIHGNHKNDIVKMVNAAAKKLERPGEVEVDFVEPTRTLEAEPEAEATDEATDEKA